MRRRGPAVLVLAAFGCALAAGSAAAGKPAKTRHRDPAEIIRSFVKAHPKSVELISFGGGTGPSVSIARGGGWKPGPAATQPSQKKSRIEIVRFPDARSASVAIVRGLGPLPRGGPEKPQTQSFDRVTFADPHYQPVTVIRGPNLASAAMLTATFEPFGPASAADLDRVAFAVDGAESSHGADPAMWRPDPGGPQGPMQVSAAAALDVGGGDRFDLGQNRALGRAYLAHLYRRYGNWPDAIAAYNWGPGNLDAWIAAGRPAGALPLETERYLARVLRDAGLANGAWPFAAAGSAPVVPASQLRP